MPVSQGHPSAEARVNPQRKILYRHFTFISLFSLAAIIMSITARPALIFLLALSTMYLVLDVMASASGLEPAPFQYPHKPDQGRLLICDGGRICDQMDRTVPPASQDQGRISDVLDTQGLRDYFKHLEQKFQLSGKTQLIASVAPDSTEFINPNSRPFFSFQEGPSTYAQDKATSTPKPSLMTFHTSSGQLLRENGEVEDRVDSIKNSDGAGHHPSSSFYFFGAKLAEKEKEEERHQPFLREPPNSKPERGTSVTPYFLPSSSPSPVSSPFSLAGDSGLSLGPTLSPSATMQSKKPAGSGNFQQWYLEHMSQMIKNRSSSLVSAASSLAANSTAVSDRYGSSGLSLTHFSPPPSISSPALCPARCRCSCPEPLPAAVSELTPGNVELQRDGNLDVKLSVVPCARTALYQLSLAVRLCKKAHPSPGSDR